MPAQCFCYNLRVVLMRCISNSAAGAANCAGDSNRRDTPRTRAGRAKSWRTKSAAPDYEKLGSFLPPSHAAQVFVHAWFRGAVGETRPLGRVPSLEKYRGRLGEEEDSGNELNVTAGLRGNVGMSLLSEVRRPFGKKANVDGHGLVESGTTSSSVPSAFLPNSLRIVAPKFPNPRQ